MESKNLMNMLKHNLTNEMLHSILIILNTPHLALKAFLFIFILLANALASYTTVTLIATYLDYSVTTNSRVIYNPPVEYPKIKICNSNQFTTKYAFNFLNLVNKREKIYDENNLTNLSYIQKRYLMNKLRFIASEILTNMPDTEKQKISHNLDDVLIACKFNYKPCASEDFLWNYDGTLGNCFNFNTGYGEKGQKIELKKSSISGRNFGLQLEFYVNYYEGLTLFNSFTSTSGMIIRIDNASHVNDNGLNTVRTSPGFDTHIGLNREFRFSLPKPYSLCLSNSFDSDLFRLIAQSSFDYSRDFCFKQCIQQLLIRDCNCTFSMFTSLFDSDKCESLEKTNCALKYYSSVYLEKKFLQDYCQPKCPLECNSTKLTFSLSFNELNPHSYTEFIRSKFSSDFIKREIDWQTAKSSIVSLNIFYETLAYTMLTESPQMDIVTLIASIGGNLGLFLGMSLFSLSELVTTLIEIYFMKKAN